MIANYHTHTWRCNHAEGTEDEYVAAARERGLRILGFSDHTPYPFPQPYVSTFRMRMNQLDDYVQTVESLRQKYRGALEIHLGLETEYYPGFFPELLSRLRDTPMEYLILGQHYMDNEIGGLYSGARTSDPEDLKRYCHQTMDAMQTGLFTYFAHPDLIRFVGDPKIYRKYMTQLCREAKSCHMPLEINLLGIRQDRWYPHPPLWEIAGEVGCQAILGIDAHAPWHLTEPYSEEAALELARKNQIEVLETAVLRPIR